MQTIFLECQTASGAPLQATFLPEYGMNMISYKMGDIEIIDQTTKEQFEKRSAGLGAIIGPHFHTKRQLVNSLKLDAEKFPHILNIKPNSSNDYFSHGIGRYAPWKSTSTPTKVTAELTGKDLLKNIPLSTLEGQNFKMNFSAELTPDGLNIKMSVVSDTASLVGIHYYYHLPENSGKVFAKVKNNHNISESHDLIFDLENEVDETYHPFPNPLEGQILLDTGTYKLLTTYASHSEENCFQLYHPKNASFVCIEPLSAKNPRNANLTVSSISINLKILS
jgi:hypothetical protein